MPNIKLINFNKSIIHFLLIFIAKKVFFTERKGVECRIRNATPRQKLWDLLSAPIHTQENKYALNDLWTVCDLGVCSLEVGVMPSASPSRQNIAPPKAQLCLKWYLA